MTRTQYLHAPDGTRLAYVDFGGPGRPVLALHGAFGRGRAFAAFADELRPDYRVIALDQRGHGLSDHPGDYSREAFVADAASVIEQLGLAPAIVVGHSLGGINAYQLAARRPELVESMVVADFPAVSPRPPAEDTWLTVLPERYPTLTALADTIAAANSFGEVAHFTESAVEDDIGWGFLWDADDVRAAKRGLRGEWWDDWTGSTQPALLVLGGDSPVVPAEHGAEMVRRRPGTESVTIDGAGHDFYLSHTARFADITRQFLGRVGAVAAAAAVGAAAVTAVTADR